MLEKIYTIPVNEAFDFCGENPAEGCPYCYLYRKLENDEIDIMLGAAMMEPEIRIKTNELGFCASHYGMMLKRKRMLGMGLILESHLAEVEKKLSAKQPPIIGQTGANTAALSELSNSCYVCQRIAHNLDAMIATSVFLFESEPTFKKKFSAQRLFCLPHYSAMVSYAQKKMNKKAFRDFLATAYGIEKKYIDELEGDVSWFCKKFDYRFDEEPWYNSKDSVQRAIKFLSGDQEDTQ